MLSGLNSIELIYSWAIKLQCSTFCNPRFELKLLTTNLLILMQLYFSPCLAVLQRRAATSRVRANEWMSSPTTNSNVRADLAATIAVLSCFLQLDVSMSMLTWLQSITWQVHPQLFIVNCSYYCACSASNTLLTRTRMHAHPRTTLRCTDTSTRIRTNHPKNGKLFCWSPIWYETGRCSEGASSSLSELTSWVACTLSLQTNRRISIVDMQTEGQRVISRILKGMNGSL